MAIIDEGPAPLGRREHHEAASAKKVIVRGLDADSGSYMNIGALDNGDGTFSLKTTATITGDVNIGDVTTDPTFKLDPSDAGESPKFGRVDAAGDMQVDVLSSALPTGAATSAKQDTIIGHVDGIESVLGTIDTDTGAMVTDLAAIEALLITIEANQLPDSHNVTVDNASLAVTGTFWQATQPVSATNLDIRDIDAATDDISVHGDVGILDQLDLTNSNPAAVAIVDADGTQITSFGGGTQYTEGDTDDSITGTAILWEDGSDTLRAVSAAKPLPINITSGNITGFATSAKQDTIIGHIDGIEALLTTIDADTSNLSVVGGGTEAAAIRVTIANDSTGVLSVDDNGSSLTVDNAGLTELAAAIGATNASQLDVYIKGSDVATGGTSAADDADFTDGTTPGTPAMGVYEATPTTVTDGDLGVVGITEARRLKTSATIDAAIPAGNNNIGDVDVASSALPTGAATSAKQDTVIGHVDGIEGLLTTIDGDTGNISTKIDTVAGAVSGSEMQVDIVSAPTLTVNAHAVTNAGTFAVQVDGSALTSLQLIDDVVYVDDADWTDDTSKHLLVGGVYQGTPHTVTDGDVTPFLTDANGRLAVSNAALTELAAAINSDKVDVNIASGNITGFATSANQTTIIGHVDGIEGLLTTIDADTGTIAGAVSGSEMQVDVVAALPAGNNNIGNVDVVTLPAIPAGTNNIGDVDILTEVSSSFDHGSNRDVDTAAEQITASSIAAKFGVTVKAATSNTGIIYVGNSDVTAGTTDATDGFELYPGESITLPVNNANLVYVIASANNQIVYWTAV